MTNNFRFAVRQIWRSPGFAAAIVLTLALGIGVNTAVFSMVNGFLLRPLPYREADRVGALVVHKEGVNERTKQADSEEDNSFDARMWQTVRDNNNAVTLAVLGGTNGANMKASVDAGGAARYVEAARVSAGYFGVVGIPLLLGREFNADEDRAGGANGVVLSHALWHAAFAEDRNILGKRIELKGEPYAIVGVLGPDALLPQRADIYTPLRILSPDGECFGGPNCSVVARLKPGVNWEVAEAQLHRIRLPYFQEIEQKGRGHAWLYARPLQYEYAGEMRGRVEVLSLAVGLILLIACANLAGLMLVRISRRSREMATRLALGATRRAIIRQLWIESAVLAALGGALGLLLSGLLTRALTNFLPTFMVPLGGFRLDLRVVGFACGAAFFTSVLFGMLPAFEALRYDLRSSIASSGRTATSGASRTRQWMIGAQVALSFVLLTSAGLLVRTLIHLATMPPGFDPQGVMTVKASLDSARYHKAETFRQLMKNSVANLEKIPGVERAAAGLSVPYERGLNNGFQAMDGPQAGKRTGSSLTYVTPGYFAALRIPLLAGRTMTEADSPTTQPVVVVNASFAQRSYNEPRPLGRHLKLADTTFTIVGIVGDVVKHPGWYGDAPLATEPVFYLSAQQAPQSLVNIGHIWYQPSWMVRTTHPVAGLTAAMQKALTGADGSLPISGAYSMADMQMRELQTQRVEVMLLGVLASLALLLSAIGTYGTVANVVVQRTREVGIRLALGSTVAQAMVEVGRSGMIAAAIGLAAGAVLSIASSRALASEIFGVSPYDALTLSLVALGLGSIALGASLLPTLRISRIQLAETLMTE